ncbi:hypothetical protein A3716_31575 [Alcanivorax sp. HI0011]|nr:hypothetical protein A3716_31575 [Alcanivorax sp. HI0011]
MVAVPLIFGELTAEHYEDDFHASHPRIDTLRDKMIVREDKQYSSDYHDPDKRSIANAIQIVFKDGSRTDKVAVEYPIGHRRRREEGIPVLESKFRRNLLTCFPLARSEKILERCQDRDGLETMPVNDFMSMLAL